MSQSSDNPFAGSGGGYGSQTVGFGSAQQQPQPTAAPSPSTDGGALIKDTTTSQFPTDVIEESRNQPVLIDFWAPWCGPCKQLTPILEAAVNQAGGKVKLVKMNIDEHPAIAGQMGVQSIPAVLAFVDGQPVDGFMGALPESQVTAFIDKVAGMAGGGDTAASMLDDALEKAQAATDAGDPTTAAQLYAAVLQQDPENAKAFAGMAGLMLDAGQDDRVKAMLEGAPDAMKHDPAIAGVQTRLDLLEKVKEIGDPAQLEARLQKDANDHDARFDLALIANAKNERETAANHLLSIMGADREWRDDGARKELLTLFEAWGPADPATAAARRRLSSLLFR
ncbi:MAG: thioredoxin [Pseudomonadota bacterium]